MTQRLRCPDCAAPFPAPDHVAINTITREVTPLREMHRGDFAICMECGSILTFDGVKLRVPLRSECNALAPRVQMGLIRASVQVRLERRKRAVKPVAIPITCCPSCGADLDFGICRNNPEPVGPRAGYIATCGSCGELLAFRTDTEVVVATLHDRSRAPAEALRISEEIKAMRKMD